MRYISAFATAYFAVALSGCGGGGGGSSSPNPPPVSTTPPSATGDMLAPQASQAWNYQGTVSGQALTLTLYVDPQKTNGVTALIGAAVTGTVVTVATSASNMQANLVGALGVTTDASNDYDVYSEVSAGSAAQVPGTPELVASTLTLGSSFVPTTGAKATVINVGTMPGESACLSTSTVGAAVEYTYSGYDYTISYVPGCGITSLRDNLKGATLTLSSIGSYPTIGQLAIRYQPGSLTYADTAASLLGMRRSQMPAAKLLANFFH